MRQLGNHDDLGLFLGPRRRSAKVSGCHPGSAAGSETSQLELAQVNESGFQEINIDPIAGARRPPKVGAYTAKPCVVDPRLFKNECRYETLPSIQPASSFVASMRAPALLSGEFRAGRGKGREHHRHRPVGL